jgi:hypothetical protein
MTVLDSLLRKKRVVLAERTRCFQEAAVSCERAERAFDISERNHAEAQRYLWEQLSSEAPLCVQRLATAKQDESRRGALLREARVTRDSAVAQLNALRQVVARLQKDIEKLEDKREERRLKSAQEAQDREWRRLDEWMTTQHGARG